jgi:hypothetical protein
MLFYYNKLNYINDKLVLVIIVSSYIKSLSWNIFGFDRIWKFIKLNYSKRKLNLVFRKLTLKLKLGFIKLNWS